MSEQKYSIRLSQLAKAKLQVVSLQKKSPQSIVASNIILHYAHNNLDFDVSSGDILKGVLGKLTSHTVMLTKIAGETSRTETWIKGLLKDEKSAVSVYQGAASDGEDVELESVGDDPRLSRALEIIRQLFDVAKRGVGYDATPEIKIHLPEAQFNRLKKDYDQLCM